VGKTLNLVLGLASLAFLSTPFFLTSAATAAQAGAKVLFYDPICGELAASSGVPPSPATGLTPVRFGNCPTPAMYIQFVGIHYWFENEHRSKSTDPNHAGADARVRLHIRSNVQGYLTVWSVDDSGKGTDLTPMVGPWHGYLLRGDFDYVVSGEFTVPREGSAARVLIWFARSQTEQAPTAQAAAEDIELRSTEIARDGAPALVRETDKTTPGQIGNYVVHREGAQAGAVILIGPTHP